MTANAKTKARKSLGATQIAVAKAIQLYQVALEAGGNPDESKLQKLVEFQVKTNAGRIF